MSHRRFFTAKHFVRTGPVLGVLILLLVTALPAAAQDGLSLHQVARLRSVTDVAVAPDGSAVAFVRVVPRDPLQDRDGAAWTELHVVDADGGERPFVTGDVNVGGIAWTPDGAGVSFLTTRPGDDRRSLYVIPADGGEARRLLSHDTDIVEYAWSPDGTQVAFLAAAAVSGEERDLAQKGFNQIVYEETVQPQRVWVANVSDDGPAAGPRVVDLPGSASTLRWSPAGDRLAVMLAPTPLVDDSFMRKTLHVVHPDSGEIVARIETAGKIGDVVWSPDGAHLAAIAVADRNDPMEGRLMVVPATGGQLTDLRPDWDEGDVHAAAWRDADTLLFLGYEGVGAFAATIGRDGTGFDRLMSSDETIVRSLAISRDGRHAAIMADSAIHPAEVFLLQVPERLLHRLTDSNPWLNDVSLAPQELVRYHARDGLELEGLLIRPLHEEPGRRYPLILVVHGGPEAHYSNGWLTAYAAPGQAGAARGFAVFYPNYRGSTGRGVRFSRLSQADAAGREFDDLVDGVDHLIDIGLVDRARVGITGGSYGGYASAWGATYYSERFAASVMFVGISNNISKFGTSDIPYELNLVHHLKWPWEDWDYALHRSPIYHVDKARTPLLIVHGSDDPRVHPGQSLELYRHLKVRTDTPVRLVLYPGEGHGNRRAATRLDYSLRLMQWMEHYLQGPGGAPPPYALTYEEQAAGRADAQEDR